MCQDYEEPPSENMIREYAESFDSLYPIVFYCDFMYFDVLKYIYNTDLKILLNTVL